MNRLNLLDNHGAFPAPFGTDDQVVPAGMLAANDAIDHGLFTTQNVFGIRCKEC